MADMRQRPAARAGGSYTETTYHKDQPTTVLGKAGGTCAATIFGVVLIFGVFPLLWWNESSSLEVYQMLTEAQKSVQLYPDSQQLESHYANKLVWVSGTVEGDMLHDEAFGLGLRGVKLRRKAEMLQWVEESQSHTTDQGNGVKKTDTTYTYHEAWKTSLVDSSRFKDARYKGLNPSSMPYGAQTKVAPSVRVGAFTLTTPLVSQVNAWQPVMGLADGGGGSASQVELRMAPDGVRYTQEEFVDYFGGTREWRNAVDTASFKQTAPSGKSMSSNALAVALPARYLLNGNTIQSFDPRSTAQVGDVKVDFEMVPEGVEVSVLARQQRDGTLVEYMAPGGSGRTLGLVYEGHVPAKQMIDDQVSANTFSTWLLRVAGYVLMYFGWTLMLSWVNTIASVFDYIPLVGGLLSGLVGLGTTLLAGVMSISLCTLTIAIAWLAVRPMLCMAVSAIIAVFLLMSGKVGHSLKALPQTSIVDERRLQ